MRNLTKTLAILSLLTPVVGYPLGIGDFKLHSALNQNLNAEIPLTLSAGENAADIKVSLAPAAKFDEAGVPWTYFLSKINFQTVVNANGSVVIKVSSKEVLKEPFLTFLVEVNWPKGNLYREFTVLVDPPSAYKTPVPIVAPVVSRKPSVTIGKPSSVVAAPVTMGKSPVVAATKPVSPFSPKPQAYEQPKQPAVAQTVRPQQADIQRSSGSSYGPIHKKETLWSIGVKFSKERNASVEQVLMAIYEANPDVFHRNNVFGLMSGKTLQIPNTEVISRLSPDQAKTAYNLQKKAWKEGVTLAPPVSTTLAFDTNKPVVLMPEKESKLEVPAINFSDNSQKKIVVKPLEAPKVAKHAVIAPVEETVSPSADAILLDKVAALEGN